MTERTGVRLEAPAKVNLHLRVLHRRPDGFHELNTVFQAISLADVVALRWADDDGAGVVLEVSSGDGTAPPELGAVNENLAVRAARAFGDATGLRRTVHIHLTKNIPAGAGLGGGSSDAAAVLRGLNALTGGGLSAEELAELASGLGSDVPFFLGPSPLAAARGRGERLSPLAPLPPTALALVLPPVHVSTADAYAALERREAVDPLDAEDAEVNGDAPWSTPDSWAAVVAVACNDFQGPVARDHPEVARSLDALRRVGGRPVLLSGSGAACFAGEVAPPALIRLREALAWPVKEVSTLVALPTPQLEMAPGP